MLKKLCVSLCAAVVAFSAQAAEVGKPAPAFAVKDIAGREQSLAAYKGKVVVLEWNNPGCPFVHKHYDSGNMQSLQGDAKKRGIVWLTVNSGAEGRQGNMTPQQAREWLSKEKAHPTAYILDPEGTLGRLYGATATPHMFVIDAKGVLAYAGAIDDIPSFDKADIKTAHNFVKAAVDSLLAGRPVEVASTKVYGCSVKYKE